MIYLLLFILIPIFEVAAFIQIGSLVGVLPTLLLCVVTAMLGAALIRYQGMQTIYNAQKNLETGKVPIQEIVDGLCLLLAGAFLLTPGFVTDTIGFCLLVPPIRFLIRRYGEAAIKSGRVQTSSFRSPFGASFHSRYSSSNQNSTPSSKPYHDKNTLQNDVIDVDYEDVPREK